MLSDADVEDHYNPTTRIVQIERNGSASFGFELTRGKWDPYPWINSVHTGTAADRAGVKPGDCVLEVNGQDLLGLRISEVAEIVKSESDQVSLLLWNAGIDAHCTPEAICCGPMPLNLQRLSACMTTILTHLECPVCLDTITPPTYQCENGHLICIRCRTKSERCPVCRLRLTRGRSLLSDQVYNTLIDAFNLKEDNCKAAKMKQIFNLKKKNVPDIIVTQARTNFGTKSSSVDNLSVDYKSESLDPLKAKSLSTCEIFLAESPVVSRSGSLGRILKANRPASCHGSFESLEKSKELIPRMGGHNLFYCPFVADCTSHIEGRMLVEHFNLHHTGPIIQFFNSNVKVKLTKVVKHKELLYVIQTSGNVFFVKLKLLLKSGKVLLWTWLSGTKKESRDYDMQVNVINEEINDVVISVRNSVCSLSGISYYEVKERKKGVLLNSEAWNTRKITLDINILKTDSD